MVIKNFEQQRILTPQEVATCVRKLPMVHIKGLKSILFMPAHEFRTYDQTVSPGCKGAYYPEYRTIVIFDLVRHDLGAHIICHEIGHYVYQRLDSRLRKLWATNISPNYPKISNYAKQNLLEDFAETYAYFALKAEQLERVAYKKYSFMQASVFTNTMRNYSSQ